MKLETKQAILRYLRDRPFTSEVDFDTLFNSNTGLFGNPLTPYRVQTQQFGYDIVRRFLKGQSIQRFHDLLERHGLSATPAEEVSNKEPAGSDTLLPGEEEFRRSFLNSSESPPPTKSSSCEPPHKMTTPTSPFSVGSGAGVGGSHPPQSDPPSTGGLGTSEPDSLAQAILQYFRSCKCELRWMRALESVDRPLGFYDQVACCPSALLTSLGLSFSLQ